VLKAERVEYIQRRLQELYPDPPVPLDHTDPYTLLVAVLLSAQCTDERVNQVTPELFERADNPEDMAELSVEEIREIIRPCGLSPQKSKAISVLSRMLIEEHDGQVPQDMEALERLPGVGHKTASVVMAQSFGVPSFPVDTHIHRLAQRWGLTSGKSVVQTERDLKRLFPREAWNDLHLQIIFYGREHCTAAGATGGSARSAGPATRTGSTRRRRRRRRREPSVLGPDGGEPGPDHLSVLRAPGPTRGHGAHQHPVHADRESPLVVNPPGMESVVPAASACPYASVEPPVVSTTCTFRPTMS
jgi:endonuclease-3